MVVGIIRAVTLGFVIGLTKYDKVMFVRV